MKKLFGFALAFGAVLALSGCSGEDGDVGSFNNNYYITDIDFAGVSNIVWSCDNGTDGVTANDGRFYTESGYSCDLDLRTHLITGNIYLENDDGPLSGVGYSCTGNDAHPGIVNGTTGINGYIDNATNFSGCTLYTLP